MSLWFTWQIQLTASKLLFSLFNSVLPYFLHFHFIVSPIFLFSDMTDVTGEPSQLWVLLHVGIYSFQICSFSIPRPRWGKCHPCLCTWGDTLHQGFLRWAVVVLLQQKVSFLKRKLSHFWRKFFSLVSSSHQIKNNVLCATSRPATRNNFHLNFGYFDKVKCPSTQYLCYKTEKFRFGLSLYFCMHKTM